MTRGFSRSVSQVSRLRVPSCFFCLGHASILLLFDEDGHFLASFVSADPDMSYLIVSDVLLAFFIHRS